MTGMGRYDRATAGDVHTGPTSSNCTRLGAAALKRLPPGTKQTQQEALPQVQAMGLPRMSTRAGHDISLSPDQGTGSKPKPEQHLQLVEHSFDEAADGCHKAGPAGVQPAAGLHSSSHRVQAAREVVGVVHRLQQRQQGAQNGTQLLLRSRQSLLDHLQPSLAQLWGVAGWQRRPSMQLGGQCRGGLAPSLQLPEAVHHVWVGLGRVSKLGCPKEAQLLVCSACFCPCTQGSGVRKTEVLSAVTVAWGPDQGSAPSLHLLVQADYES